MSSDHMHAWLEEVTTSSLMCAECGIVVNKGDAVAVGDTMRISVELIRDMVKMPDFSSALVKVVRVDVNDDGTKTMWMERAE